MSHYGITDGTIQYQQDTAQAVLLQIKEFFDPQAFVAGGAPRNWLLGKPARDIDIFFRSPMLLRDNVMKLILENVKGSTRHDDEDVAEIINYQKFMPGVRRVLRIKVKGLSFDLVQVDKYANACFKTSILDMFNSNVCRVGWDGELRDDELNEGNHLVCMNYLIAPDFINFQQEGVLRFEYRNPSDKLRFHPGHVLRMVELFPEYPVVIKAPMLPSSAFITGASVEESALLNSFFPVSNLRPNADISQHFQYELFMNHGSVCFNNARGQCQSFMPVLKKAKLQFVNSYPFMYKSE